MQQDQQIPLKIHSEKNKYFYAHLWMKTRSLFSNMIFISSLSIYQIKWEYYKTMEMSIMYSYIYKLMKFAAKNAHTKIS